MWVILAKYDNISVSTPWAYQTYRQQYGDAYVSDPVGVQDRTANVRAGGLVNAIAHQNIAEIGQYIYNDLEKVVLPKYPQIAELKAAFTAQDVLGTMMSGSGPTVFALCDSEEKAIAVEQAVKAQMNDPQLKFWITKTTTSGIQIKP